MLKYATPLIKHYNRIPWNPDIPTRVKNILHDTNDKPLRQSKSILLMNYYLNNNFIPPKFAERSYVIRYLYERQAYTTLIAICKRFLFVEGAGSDLRDDISLNELKRYLNALIRTQNFAKVDVALSKFISKFSIKKRTVVVDLINSMFVSLNESTKQVNEMEPLLKWAKWVKLLNGHCDYSDYMQNKYILKTMLFYLQEKRENGATFFIQCVDFIRGIEGAATASQCATTLMFLAAYCRKFSLVEALWNFKVSEKLPIVKPDLTSILRSYCHFEKYDLVKPTHTAYPDAHDEQSQFDYLLVAYAKLANWQGLQDQFNSLFGIGELPNIQHYGIVMHSIATIGELESVEKLYSQLLRREMIPTLAVLQSLLLAHYKAGDLEGCFTQFELFEKYSIQPTASTYTLMLKVYRGLNNIDGALRLLKRMTESDKLTITETHFAIIIHMCCRFTNYPIAQELFHIMIDHYHILPTGASVAALMDVCIAIGQPQEALKLFKRHAKLDPVAERLISVYNKAIKAYIEMGDQSKCEHLFKEILSLKLSTDSEFYNIMIRYLVNLKKDYETAESVLEQLLKHPNVVADASHFESIMEAYDRISHREGILNLYKKMNQERIPVNSKILHLLIKATFKIQMQTQGNLEQSIDLLDRIMKNAAERTLDITFGRLHPSTVAWPVRVIAKYHNPMRALQLLNRYNSLFYGKEDSSMNNRFVVMRSLLVLSAEMEQWEDFQNVFNQYLSRIQKFEKLPSATVKNKRLSTLFVGLLTYKIRHLVATNSTHILPAFLSELQQKGYIIDNISWNEAIRVLFKDSRTIKAGLEIVDRKLIHGYNLIHKYRLLKKGSQESTSINKEPWLIRQKKAEPTSFQPSLYLKSDSYAQVMESMDRYLNSFTNVKEELRNLITEYPYFMKSYLMKPRDYVNGWERIESEHTSYLAKIRTTKRIVPISEF